MRAFLRRRSSVARLAAATIVVGVGGGVSGALVTLVLHAVQHLAYGYSVGTFLTGVTRSTPETRVIALAAAGVVGGLGWWAVRRWLPRVVSIESAVQGRPMPALTTVANAALQVVVVALGASVGREGAPRELGALIASRVTRFVGLDARATRTLIACGAGAGLAAVYSVPLGGALFVVEVLLGDITLGAVLPAIVTCAIATLVARAVVPDTTVFSVPAAALSVGLVVWSLIAGPLVGLAALLFRRAMRAANRMRPTGRGVLIRLPVACLATGLLAVLLPDILGNGRALGQVALAGTLPIAVLLVLAVTKAVATSGTIAAGAAGGTLTPSIAIGVALGAAGMATWDLLWPGTSVAAGGAVGGAAFLAVVLEAPVSAIALLAEFIGIEGAVLLLPFLIAVAGATVSSRLLARALPGADRRDLGAP